MSFYSSKQCLLLILLLIPLAYSEVEIKFVFAMCRHGARSPYNRLNDSFHDVFGEQWDGIKELTGVGQRQHYLLGLRNRIRYIENFTFLNEEFDPKEIKIYSTDANRTIMSANAQMQGMYPEGGSITESQKIFSDPPNNISWFKEERDALNYSTLPHQINVIPVHTFYSGDHYIQLQDRKNCKGMEEYYDKKMNSKEVNDILHKIVDTYGEMIENFTTGVNRDDLLNHSIAYSVLDAYLSNYYDGRGALDKFGDSKEALKNDSLQFFKYEVYGANEDDVNNSPYAMSPIFKDILNWTEERKDKENNITDYNSPKFVLYSGHDTTLGAFEAFMKYAFSVSFDYPYLASNLNLELIKNDSKLFVVYYFNDQYKKAWEYEEFKSIVEEKIKTTDEVYQFCGIKASDNKDEEEDGESNFKTASIVFGALAGVLILGNILTFFLLKRE